MWPTVRRPGSAALIPLVAGTVAGITALWIIRPVHSVLVGTDTASSVLYFDRIVAGERLERFLGTTPKPLLTAVDGLLHALTGDWRPIVWLAVVVYALAIAATVALTSRTAGPAAAAFVATGLVASGGLLQDVALAYAVSWSLLAVAVAGLALTVATPRYGLAGTALAIGSLARQEVILVTVVAVVVLSARAALARVGRVPGPTRTMWLVSIGFVAIPVTAVHDLWLTGDPLYTLEVSTISAAGADVGGVAAAIQALGRHGLGVGLLLPLAVLGAGILVRTKAWVVGLGLVTVVTGVAAVLLAIGARRLIVLDRYALPVELGLVVLAGVGWSVLGRAVLGRAVGPRRLPLVLSLLGVVVALVSMPRIGPIDQRTLGPIRIDRQGARDYATLLVGLRRAVEVTPLLRVAPGIRDPRSRVTDGPAVFVTARLLPQAAVDLDLRLDRIVRLPIGAPDGAFLPGSLVLHLPRLLGGAEDPRFEIDRPRAVGGITVTPLDHVGRRAWLDRVDQASP